MMTRSISVFCVAGALSLCAQESRTGVVFVPIRDHKLETIRQELRGETKPAGKPKMQVDFAAIRAPKSLSEFTVLPHQEAVCQGLSGMCWSFSTTSFLESEAQRKGRPGLRFSVMHTVYWEYVEKAKGFVRSRGTSVFGEGSQGAAVIRAWKQHGALPASAYTGLKGEARNYDHEMTVFKELKAYLEGVKAAGAWDEAPVVAKVRAILDRHLGAPPTKVTVDGRTMTPQEYVTQVAGLNLDDYVELVSFSDRPAWQRTEYNVPDNWWHGKEYLNVPLDDFMTAFKGAVRQGFSLALAADMSEPGYSIGAPGLAVVPTWDIPSAFIDAAARQFRFEDGSTTDDHGLHVVGHARTNGQDWFLVKDSWSSAWNNDHPGYYFFHEDYVKLKVLGFMVHKDAVKGLLEKMKM